MSQHDVMMQCLSMNYMYTLLVHCCFTSSSLPCLALCTELSLHCFILLPALLCTAPLLFCSSAHIPLPQCQLPFQPSLLRNIIIRIVLGCLAIHHQHLTRIFYNGCRFQVVFYQTQVQSKPVSPSAIVVRIGIEDNCLQILRVP